MGLLGMYIFLALVAVGALVYSNIEQKREQKEK